MKTIKAVVVVGLNAGYFHKNQSEATPADFGRLYQQTADEVFEKSGIYVGSLISGASVLYKEDWGCPAGGEDAIRIEADCNPTYASGDPAVYIDSWKKALVRIIEVLMERLSQTTVTLTFIESEMLYLKK